MTFPPLGAFQRQDRTDFPAVLAQLNSYVRHSAENPWNAPLQQMPPPRQIDSTPKFSAGNTPKILYRKVSSKDASLQLEVETFLAKLAVEIGS